MSWLTGPGNNRRSTRLMAVGRLVSREPGGRGTDGFC